MLIKFRNEESIEEGMFDKYSRFHFIPLLCGASLYIIGESFSSEGLVKDPNSPFVFSIIISVIGLASLIFIYFKTNIESHTYSRLITKKGFYSCLIALFVYNLYFTISFYGTFKRTLGDNEAYINKFKRYSIAISVLTGLINLVLAFILKDIGIASINILIYLGLIINFSKIDEKTRELLNGNTEEGIIDIVMEGLAVIEIIFLVIKYKKGISGEEQRLI